MQQKLVAALLPLVATVILVIAGSALTGPSMNPAHAFSWNFFLQVSTHHTRVNTMGVTNN
jgi:hypothetical protein